MYDPSDLNLTTKEIVIGILTVFIVLVCVFGAGYFCGIRNATGTDANNVHNHGAGVDDVRDQLGQAVSHQQQITDGIKDAEQTTNAAAGTTQAIAESAHSIEAGVGEAAGLIDSSQQILGRVRNRGQAGTTPN